MLRTRSIWNACSRCNAATCLASRRTFSSCPPLTSPRLRAVLRDAPSQITYATARQFVASRYRWQDSSNSPDAHDAEDIEKIVRDAKQRFRDTLPSGYLNEKEYALYERLYGPPLRETDPEDVGIPMHADMGSEPPRPPSEGTLLREVGGGEFEEVTYEISREAASEEDPDPVGGLEDAPAESEAPILVEKAPGYVETVSRSKREQEAMQKLQQDFELAQSRRREAKKAAASREKDEAEVTDSAPSWTTEEDGLPRDELEDEDDISGPKIHPLTMEGRFHGVPIEEILPQSGMVQPIRDLLDRTHLSHVKTAAEKALGGVGLPDSPGTIVGRRSGKMKAVGLPPAQRHMTEVEADAFLAAYLPPAYASIIATLREVRKRLGSEWLQSRLTQRGGAGINVLDAGGGGAGLIAWEKIVRAEWDLLKEEGKVTGQDPPGKKTVIAASDRLRHRLKSFLHNTTFLPRLPDYEHSGQTHGEHLDAGKNPQPRKSYDVIIASHLFLQETKDHYRQAILNSLWSLLSKDGGVLIVLEKAHPRGFEAVAHVRDTILNQFLLPQSGRPAMTPEEFSPAYHRELEPGYIIAPCTNQGTCPMYQTPGKGAGRKDFCHFSQRFVRPQFHTKVVSGTGDNQGRVEFSYVAFQRGVAKESHVFGKEATDKAFRGYEHSETRPDMRSLPRMILPPLKRKGHITLDVCTPGSTIERWTVPKSFSKQAYSDARKSKWGDLWALGAKTRTMRKAREGRPEDDDGKKKTKDKKRPHSSDAAVNWIPVDTADMHKALKSLEKKDRMKEMLETGEPEMGDEGFDVGTGPDIDVGIGPGIDDLL